MVASGRLGEARVDVLLSIRLEWRSLGTTASRGRAAAPLRPGAEWSAWREKQVSKPRRPGTELQGFRLLPLGDVQLGIDDVR